MQSSPRQVNGVDESRAARLRDNKRRNRQRHKEYTTSLETKLRELKEQGVQATQEVQHSARKVVEDNARLKALLRHIGVDDHVIETWTPSNPPKPPNAGQSTWPTGPNLGCEKKLTGACNSNRKDPLAGLDSVCSPIVPIYNVGVTAPQSKPTPRLCQNNCTVRQVSTTSNCESIAQDRSITLALPPCKVFSRLAENPSADITQPIAADMDPNDQENGGVECSKAHAMLMQFATTEEKLDIVSQALERGCVRKAGGGCKVQNEAIWKAMDDVT